MINLQRYVMIYEGGQAGHMAHPFDYTDFTGNDLIDIVDSIFSGKIEQMKEKLDGDNILATVNPNGQVVFIRNNTHLNSEQGGMTIEDMEKKWEDNPHTQKVYVMAGKTIEKIFKKLPIKYFNPDSETKKLINCECIIAGETNIMPYASDRVAFHGYHIYKKENNKWVLKEDNEGGVEEIYKAAEGIDTAKPRPNLVFKSIKDGIQFATKFKTRIENLFKEEGLSLNDSIEDWKRVRFKKYAPEWCKDDIDIFNRVCNGDNSVNANVLKKRYPDHKADISELNKSIKKSVCAKIMEPLDGLFLSLGNELIDMLEGFTNDGAKDEVIKKLKSGMESTVELIKQNGSADAQSKIEKNLIRLQNLGNKFNAAEGIVFTYKGRRMKLTGSFACINQIMGTRFTLEK